jgi:hypothetical protein
MQRGKIEMSAMKAMRRVLLTFCLTFVSAVFWAFMFGELCRFLFGIHDQATMRLVIGIAAICIGAIVLPLMWRFMETH